MNCREFEEVVHELARPGRLGDASRQLALWHAGKCPPCAERLEEARWLADALEIAAADGRKRETPARVEARLLAALGERHRRRRARRFAAAWASAAAAVMLIVVAAHWRQRHSARPASPAFAAPQAVPSSSEVRRPGAEAGNASSAQAAAGELDLTSGFVAVPYSDDFGPADSGMVVRVEMPRAALADLGYPVDEARSGDLVQADLVVGEDGWPRAVRVVR